MKKERLDILIDIYNAAIKDNSIHVGYKMSLDDLCCGGIDLEYLEEKGFIESGKDGDPDKGFIFYLTVEGLEVVEYHLDKIKKDEQFQNQLKRDLVDMEEALETLIKHESNVN